jgi:hypothetical protein
MIGELGLSVRSIMQSHVGYGLCGYPRVSKHASLYEVRLWAPYQTHNVEGQGALFFVRQLNQNWSGMGGPTSSYIATVVVFAGVHKYPNEAQYAFDKTEIPLRVQAQIIKH